MPATLGLREGTRHGVADLVVADERGWNGVFARNRARAEALASRAGSVPSRSA